MSYNYPTFEELKTARTVEDRFKLLDNARYGKLEYLREMAKYVNAGLLPDYDYGQDDELLTERYSSTATVLAEQLTAKIVASIYPLNNVPWFNWLINPPAEFSKEDTDDAAMLAQDVEFMLTNRLEASNYRQALHTAILQCMVVADAVIYHSDEYEFRVYPVDDFVLRRDAAGLMSDLIIRDWLDTETLPPELASLNSGKEKSLNNTNSGRSEPHYTRLSWNTEKKHWDVTKEFRQVQYETDKSYKVSPYYHINWSRVHNEDYGRSLVEMNWGTIRSLEMLHKARTELSAAMSRAHPVVNPEGATSEEDIDNEDIKNMDVLSAREEDVWWLTAPLNPQFAGLSAAIQDTEERLSKVFLADTARSLRGERVTAFQVQEAVSEMEQSLGNVLGVLARQVQQAVVERSLVIEQKTGNISPDTVAVLNRVGQLEIKSGLDALGRQLEGARLQSLLGLLPALPPEAAQSIDFGKVLNKLMTSAGLNPKELQYSPEELEQMQAQQQQAAIQQQIAQQAIQTTGNVVEAQARQGG